MNQESRYEVFDRICEEGMQEKKVEKDTVLMVWVEKLSQEIAKVC